MRKNGFTLIELLAVIVILAIIALIATPIILGIINDAREKANERTVELYASAVKNGIAAYQLREMKEVQAGTYTSETLPFDVEYDGDVECSTIELYEDGGVYVAGCTVNDLEVEYAYGTKQVFKGVMSSVCNPISVATEGEYTAGDKYECDVDPNKEGYDQIFYVLTTVEKGATSINLIMDRNINSDGTAATKAILESEKDSNGGIYNLPIWIKENEYQNVDTWTPLTGSTDEGPVTLFNFLNNATKDWDNVLNTKIEYSGDFIIKTDNSNVSIIKNDRTTITATYKNLKARLPYKSEINNYDGTNSFLYEYLHLDCWKDEDKFVLADCEVANYFTGVNPSGNHIMDMWDYALIGAQNALTYRADYTGEVSSGLAAASHGVRPVINLSI